MTLKYIVGFDESPPARAALDFTRGLARRTGARVVAAHVYPSLAGLYAAPFGAPAPFAYAAVEGTAQAAAERRLADIAGDVEARSFANASVSAELHELARVEAAALLAIGATHHGAVGRVVLGSIAERVVHGAPCPVLVVPERDGGRAIETIAVAYDGHTESRRALRAAEVLAARIGASMRLVTAVEAGPAAVYLPASVDEIDAALGSSGSALLARAAERARGRGLRVETTLVLAPAGPAIVAACAEGVDLLVTGSRGYGPLRSVMLGAVSRYIADHAPCPVLVLPRGARMAVLTEPLTAAAAAGG